MSNPDIPTPSVPSVPEVPDVPRVPNSPDVPSADGAQLPTDEAPSSAQQPAVAHSGYGVPVPPAYGVPVPQPGGNPYASTAYGPPALKQPVLSILSLVTGIIAVLGSPIGFVPIIGGVMGLFIPIAAIVLGFLGRSKEPGARGYWLTGLITGWASLALALLSIVIWVLIIATAPGSDGTGFDSTF